MFCDCQRIVVCSFWLTLCCAAICRGASMSCGCVKGRGGSTPILNELGVSFQHFSPISGEKYAVDVRADGSGSRQYRRHDPGGARGPAGRVCGGHWSARPARQSCRARTGGAHACMRQCATRPARVCMSIPDPARSPHSDATPPSAVGLSRYQPLAEQASADAVVFPRARDEKVCTQPCFSILESGISDRTLPCIPAALHSGAPAPIQPSI